MEEIKKELQNLKEEIIQSDDDIDIKADENSYLDSLWDDEYEDNYSKEYWEIIKN